VAGTVLNNHRIPHGRGAGGGVLKIVYKIIISVDAAKLVQPINDVETSINDTLSTHGVSEKLRIRTRLPVALKVSRELNKKERDDMRKLLIESFDRQLGANAKIESFRRQSGKSCCNSSL
jgi:hypothetical protein